MEPFTDFGTNQAKSPPSARMRGCSADRERAGLALVVMLSILVLLTVLVVAFFTAVRTDTESSTANRDLGRLRNLSELPLEIIKKQLWAGTTTGQTGDLNSSTNTWVSQPGLIRIFDNDGDLVRAVKLYSSSQMESDSVDFIGSEIPGDWSDQANRWVNLNEAVQAVTPSGTTERAYPILNPAADTWAEGLTIDADPAGQMDSDGNPSAAMPAEWLYVLQDGSVVSQDDISSADPPVGRIAFWTDDESCKININTAGERTMWDRPRVWAWTSATNIYSRNQPSTGEYNAYPGHPATVSLSSAFEKHDAFKNLSSAELVETMLSLSPRYAWGGSKDRSLSIWDSRISLDRADPSATIKNDRLLATTGEYVFKPMSSSADERQISHSGLEVALRNSDFLITESSRAPELNVFGMPRVGIWPISTDPAKRTVYDNVIARCLTIGGKPDSAGSKPYHFQRTSPVANAEATSIARNWEILQYLDRVTQRKVNGSGGSFQDKWGEVERRQILTQIFDYIRGGVNLSDTSYDDVDEYSKQFTPANQPMFGFVLPTTISEPGWNTRGFGRAPILTHAAIVFYAYEDTSQPPLPEGETRIHALLWFNFFSPMQGMAPYTVDRGRIKLNSYSFKINSESLVFRGTESNDFKFGHSNPYNWGGYEGMPARQTSTTYGYIAGTNYDFHTQTPPLGSSDPYAGSVRVVGSSFSFTGGTLELDVLLPSSTGQQIQSYEIEFPDSTAPWPVPLLWNDKRPTPPQKLITNRVGTAENAGTIMLGPRTDPGDGSGGVPVDVIRTVELKDGDPRMLVGLTTVPSHYYAPGDRYYDSASKISGSLMYYKLSPVRGAQFGTHVEATFKKIVGTPSQQPPLQKTFDGKDFNSLREAGWSGDFDNGYLREPDGPYINKPDEGHVFSDSSQLPYSNRLSVTEIGDQKQYGWEPQFNGFFSPTRQMPSPVMFGSLPAAVKRTEAAYAAGEDAQARPWETLLFCPNSQAAMVPDGEGATGHPGAQAPKDHLLLDFFTMPVVEPYAISEPLSTAGKINLNQRLIPFIHITRETALHGLLKDLEFMAVDTADAEKYRSGPGAAPALRTIDVPATLDEIGRILDPNNMKGQGVFRSASEICDVFLIPNGLGTQSIQEFWRTKELTGDNSREVPYNYLYPLLTTKSNTYQVHYRVQSLTPMRQKANYDPANDFVVTGEQRGSYVIERYIDSDDPRFSGVSPEVDTDNTSLNEFYQFRVLRHRRFTPSH